MSTAPRGWQRLLTWQERANLRYEAAGWQVEANLEAVNALFRQLANLGVPLEDDLRAYGFDVLRRVQQRTPIRTGRAQNSWHAVLPGTTDNYEYSDNEGHRFDGTLPNATAGPLEMIVGSNVEYMISLESGHSRQAPSGMVAMTLAEVEGALEARVARLLEGL